MKKLLHRFTSNFAYSLTQFWAIEVTYYVSEEKMFSWFSAHLKCSVLVFAFFLIKKIDLNHQKKKIFTPIIGLFCSFTLNWSVCKIWSKSVWYFFYSFTTRESLNFQFWACALLWDDHHFMKINCFLIKLFILSYKKTVQKI